VCKTVRRQSYSIRVRRHILNLKVDGGHYRILDSRAKLFLCFIRLQDLAFDSLIEIMAATGIVMGILDPSNVWDKHFILSPLATRVTDLSFRRESAPWVYLWAKGHLWPGGFVGGPFNLGNSLQTGRSCSNCLPLFVIQETFSESCIYAGNDRGGAVVSKGLHH